MNYDSKKLVSENTETTKNLIVENKVETLFTPKTSNEVISEITLKQIFKEVWDKRQNLISEQWARLSDQLGYWKILFDNLKKSGIGVKWQVANDPVKSTFMYWGPWVIWKDTTKNGGWPITFTTADKKLYSFKFQGGKYAGQPANNIKLESKQVNAIFDLSQWGKVTGAVGGPQLANLMKTKPKSGAAAAACKTVDGKPIPANQIPTVAKQIFDELAYAFDGAGTYEGEAVAAYKKITCKPILDAVNAKVAARNMRSGTFSNGPIIKNVGDWAKDEMSDYDFIQYRQIWSNLQKLGYKAPPVNYAMATAGAVGTYATPLGYLEAMGEGAKKFLDKFTFDDIMEGIRSFLLGGVGGVITTIIEFTGVGRIATTIVWGAVAIYDIYNATIGKVDWAKILMSALGLIAGGIIGKKLGNLLKPFFGAGGTISKFVAKIKTQKWFKYTLGPFIRIIQKIATYVGKGIGGAIAWLEKSVIGKIIPKGIKTAFSKFVKWLEDLGAKLAAALGEGNKLNNPLAKQAYQKEVGKEIVKDVGEKARDYGFEYGGQAVDYLTGTDYGSYGAKIRKLGKSSEKIGELDPKKAVSIDRKPGEEYTQTDIDLMFNPRARGELYTNAEVVNAKNQLKNLTTKLYKNVDAVGSGVGKTYDKGLAAYNQATTPNLVDSDPNKDKKQQNTNQPAPNNPRA